MTQERRDDAPPSYRHRGNQPAARQVQRPPARWPQAPILQPPTPPRRRPRAPGPGYPARNPPRHAAQGVAMTSTVGEAAKLTVEEEPGGPRFRKWRPFPASRSVRTGDESDEGLVDSPQPLTVPQNAPVSQPAGAAHACRGSARTGDESDET